MYLLSLDITDHFLIKGIVEPMRNTDSKGLQEQSLQLQCLWILYWMHLNALNAVQKLFTVSCSSPFHDWFVSVSWSISSCFGFLKQYFFQISDDIKWSVTQVFLVLREMLIILYRKLWKQFFKYRHICRSRWVITVIFLSITRTWGETEADCMLIAS